MGTDGMAVADEVALLERASKGDAAAVRHFLDGVGPTVYGFVFARVGGNEQAAQDVTQDALVEACRSAPTFRGDAALATWVCAIARRRLFRYYEEERRQELARAGLTLAAAPPASTNAELVEDRDEVVRALGLLAPTQRQVLVLKYLDGRSVAEIAEELGRTPVQIQSLLQRGRDSLRAKLEAAS